MADHTEGVVEQNRRARDARGGQELVGLGATTGDAEPDEIELACVLLSELLNVGPLGPTDGSTG